MSKRKAQAPKNKPQDRQLWRPRRIALLIVLGLLLIPVGRGFANLYSAPSSHKGLASFFSGMTLLPTPTPTPVSLNKEYIYAGGKLIATEEPTSTNSGGGSSTLSAPAGLTATVASVPQVSLNWTASTSGTATVDHYELERSPGISGTYTTVVPPNFTGTSFTDTTVTPGHAYLYRVRAVDTSSHTTAYSNLDYATAMVFQPIVPLSTRINSQNFEDLRTAVNAVRALAPNLPSFDWTSPAPTHGGPIKASHIQQLRTNLNEALQALSNQQVASATGYLSQAYTDPNISSPTPTTTGTPVKKAHITELRDRVRGYQAP